MANNGGYILRISTKEWVDQVFDLAIYYTSSPRNWKAGQLVVFAHKTSNGDAFVGYGEICNVYSLDELSDKERLECQKWGWRKAMELKYVIRFNEPLLVKRTFFKDSKLRGRSLHGFALTDEQVNSIISQGEQQ
jgi:hypothetical protein